MKKFLIVSTVIVGLALTMPVFAKDEYLFCNKMPAAQPMQLSSFFQKLEGEGYKVREFEYERNCYKIEGYDANSRRIKAYFSDTDGTLLHVWPDL